MRGALSAAGLCGVAVLGGCATNSSALEEELSRLRREVRAMHQKVGDAELKLERLEGRVTLLGLGGGGEVAPAPKTPVVGASEPQQQRPATKKKSEPPKINQLAGPQRSLPVVKLSSTSEEDGYDQGAVDDGSPPIMIKLGPSDDAGEELPIDHGVLVKPDPVLDAPKRTRKAEPIEDEAPRRKVSKSELKAAYEIALAKLRIDRDPAGSRALFERFTRRYPSSEYADNVAFWMAECDFFEKRHEDAAKGYQQMIDAFPRSPKVPDALVRQAESKRALGQEERADVLLGQVVAQYPDSEAAKKAKRLLQAGEGGR